MNVYKIYCDLDGSTTIVEAPGFGEAIDLWRQHSAKKWGDDYEGDEQPQSVEMINDEPVVRDSDAINALARLVDVVDKARVAHPGECWRVKVRDAVRNAKAALRRHTAAHRTKEQA